MEKGTVLLLEIFHCMQNCSNQFWVIKHLFRGFLKIFKIFFFPPIFSLLILLPAVHFLFLQQASFPLFFFSGARLSPAHGACSLLGSSPAEPVRGEALPTVGLIQRRGKIAFRPWPEGTPAVSLTAGGHPGASTSTLA